MCGGEVLPQLHDVVAVAALQRGDLQGEGADDGAPGVRVDSGRSSSARATWSARRNAQIRSLHFGRDRDWLQS